jgi:hypothetical protein
MTVKREILELEEELKSLIVAFKNTYIGVSSEKELKEKVEDAISDIMAVYFNLIAINNNPQDPQFKLNIKTYTIKL